MVIIIGLRNFTEELSKKRQLEEAKTYNSFLSNTSSISEMLDNFIQDIFNEYQIFNAELFMKEYINEADQDKIRYELIAEVQNKLSPVLYSQLILYFNKAELPNVIVKRCTLVVVQFATERNSDNE